MVFSARHHEASPAEHRPTETVLAWRTHLHQASPSGGGAAPGPPSSPSSENEGQTGRPALAPASAPASGPASGPASAPASAPKHLPETFVDRLLPTPEGADAQPRPGVWGSPVSGLMAQRQISCPQLGRPVSAAPAPLRAPWHDMHETLAEEICRSGRLADDNARLRLHNSELCALVASQRTRLLELENIDKAYQRLTQLSRRQRTHLTELQRTAAQTQAQLSFILERAMAPPDDAADDDAAEAGGADAVGGDPAEAPQDDLMCAEELS